MNVITKTALANFKKNKSRNILIGIAVMLTAMLLTVVPSVVYTYVDLQNTAVNHIYPTFHGMFREVDDSTAARLEKDDVLTDIGLREDPAQIACGDPGIDIVMVWGDNNMYTANRLELASGTFPGKADEIVVSRGLLDVIGLTGEIGDKILIPFQVSRDGGLGIEQKKEFTITGFTADSEESKENGVYSALISREFAQEIIPEGEHKYRVYFRLAGSDRLSTDAIEERMKGVAADYQIKEDNLVENTEYLSANYLDPTMYGAMAAIMVIIVFAGILTIYSIYYVSMLDKVQEYGKLKAIGTTKRQIRQIVFREGFAVAAIAIPLGLVLGAFAAIGITRKMVTLGADVQNALILEMEKALSTGEVSLLRPWILLLAAAVTLLAVYMSLLKPMRKAAKISAIEAIHFQGTKKKGRKDKNNRKGYAGLNIRKLTARNLGRNKKRTAVTIATLGVTGVFFIMLATVLSCMNTKVVTMDYIWEDIEVRILSRQEDKMHPEWELRKIQQNNPLTEELRQQILDIDGIRDVEIGKSTEAIIQGLAEEESLQVGLGGMGEKGLKELRRYVKEGSLDDRKLRDGTGIILSGHYYVSHFLGADWSIGDKIQLSIADGDSTVSKEFEIVAIADAPDGLTGDSFYLPAGVLQEMCRTDVTYKYCITTEKGKAASAEQQVEALIEGQENLEMDTWTDQYDLSKKLIGSMEYGCYALLFILGLISILNFINTMINSVYVRRREIGVLQAVGLSGKQTIHMLQMEGLFYTAGTLVLSLGVGSIAGYACFLKAKAEHIMSIRTYQYPVVPAVVLTVIMLTVQLLITYLVHKSLNKQSLIDRIRFSE